MISKRIDTLSAINERLLKNQLLSELIDVRNLTSIILLYDQPHRFYHNYNHLWDLLQKIHNNSVKQTTQVKEILEIVALFHDAVYDPKLTNNEKSSALLFWNYLKKSSLDSLELECHIIYQAIIDTAYGLNNVPRSDAPKNNQWYQNRLFEIYQIFKSIDLEGMYHCDMNTLLENEQLIFKEYQFCDYNDYKRERVKFLSGAFDRVKLTLPAKDYEIFNSYIQQVNNRQPKIGIYAGSFNPFHIGHYNILQQAEEHFDKVIILAANNRSKGTTENKQRLEKLQETLPYHQVVEWDGLLIDYIVRFKEEYGFKPTLIRGLRNGSDLEYEINLRTFLKDSEVDFDVVYYIGDTKFQHISSSAVRELMAIDPLVANNYLLNKFKY